MSIRSLSFTAAFAMSTFCSLGYAEDTDNSAEGFANLYLTICMQNLPNLEALRTKLINGNLPKFPPQQAAPFLNGQAGDVWPVPHHGQLGNFVLALPTGKNFCAIHARRSNTADAEDRFVKLVAKAPSPLVSERREDKEAETGANGKTHTIAYTWSLPQAKRKMLFMLTTASSENAQLQALGSASMISE